MVRHYLTIGCALAMFSCAAAHAQDCSIESSLKSSQPGAAVELSFRNASSASRRLYWLDPNGDRKFIAVVTPGTVLRQPTSAGHAWVVTDDAEKCLHAVTAAAEPATIDVGGTQTAQAAPPAPGIAQPIAAPVEAAIVAPPAPQMQPAPMMAQSAPPAAPIMAAAPPQNVAVQLPQVSPVEQFQLNGAYRFAPREDEAKALNSQATGTIEATRVKPEWDSGQWVFEPVAGTPFVRIRNQWKKTVLTDVEGKLRATGAPPQASDAHWTFEPVDGTTFVQLRNRETDRFLLAVNGAPTLVDDFRQDQEIQSHWSVNPVGRAVAAATPRNAAYDMALADCRNLGGHWTGSSCRAVNMAQPLSCRPGWAWAPDVGECVWAGGGRCPPWQMGAGGACLSDIACRGGRVRMSSRGYPVCDCPIGAVTWGNYPNLACVPSIARVTPYLIPAALGAAGVVILGQQGFIGAPGRPTVGQVFGNTKFGGQGGNNNTGVTVNVPVTPTAVTPQAPVTVAAPTTPTTVAPPRPVTAAPPTITRDPAPTNRPVAPTAGTPQTPVTTAVPTTPAAPAPTGIGTAVTTATPAPANNPAATDTLVKNFAGFDAQTKASVLESCKRIPGDTSCNAILRSQGLLTDGQQAAINSCKSNPNLPGCAQVLLNIGLGPRTAPTPAVGTATVGAQPDVGAGNPTVHGTDGSDNPFTIEYAPTGIRKTTTVDPKTGDKSVVTFDPKTGMQTNQLFDKNGQVGKTLTVKVNPGTTVAVDPKTGVAKETTADPKTGINTVKETNLKTGTETAYKVDTNAAPPPAPPAPPNVTTPPVATAKPGTLARPGAVGAPNPKPAVQGGVATPTAVTTPATNTLTTPATGGAKVATPAAVPAAPAVGTKPAIPAVAPNAVQNNPVTGPNQPLKPTVQKEPESRQATTNPTTPAGTVAPPGKPAGATGTAPKPQAPQVQPQRPPPAPKPVQPVQIAKPAPAPQVAKPAAAPQAANPAKKCPQGQERC